MTGEARKKALHELKRLEKMPPSARRRGRPQRTWTGSSPHAVEQAHDRQRQDIEAAEAVHRRRPLRAGEVKERILEFLAVRKLTEPVARADFVPCGAAGCGQEFFGLARWRKRWDRHFVRFSLGGVRDEAEIRGHRRTYIGSMPGTIVQAMRQAGVRYPVLLLTRVDKMGAIPGDPASALLEVLDPGAKHGFADHYLEVPFDLSEVLFLTTANNVSYVHGRFWTAWRVVSLPGYTERGLAIARRHLLPKQKKAATATEPEHLQVSDNALGASLREYTREAGVRALERHWLRCVARRPGTCGQRGRVTDAGDGGRGNLERYLGPPRYRRPRRGAGDRVGSGRHGLAYTELGGDIMDV